MFSVHIGRDTRNGFTNCFVCEFTRQDQWLNLESTQQYKYIKQFEGNDYVVDIDIFSETYYVYSFNDFDYILNDFEVDLGSLLGKIHEEKLKLDKEGIKP